MEVQHPTTPALIIVYYTEFVKCFNKGIDECHVSKLTWNGVFWAIFTDKDCYGYSESYIGKNVFFAREQAEKALKGGAE